MPKISLSNGQTELETDPFIAVGFEKSKAAKNWEDTDYFNIVVVTRSYNQKYYIVKIEHSADILSPKYIEDELNIHWVEETTASPELELINNLYSLNDSRCQYTLTVDDKPYLFYEKYFCYLMSVKYEIWENYDNTEIEASPFLKVTCKLSSSHITNIFDDLPSKTLEYQIPIYSLFKTSIFKFNPFEIWDGNVTVDGVKVTLS